VKASSSSRLVIDTNVALDILVFNEPAHAAQIAPLRMALREGRVEWLATTAMRSELERVLSYPKLAPRVAFYGCTVRSVLGNFDGLVRLEEQPAPRIAFTCKDADDQIFADLAVARQAHLLSKDHALLSMKKRLATLGAQAWTPQGFIESMLTS
jgi:putative PIN family toxin of toxin-antitoxin system